MLKVLFFDVVVFIVNWFCDNLLKECNVDDKIRVLVMVSRNWISYILSCMGFNKKMLKFIFVIYLKLIEGKILVYFCSF